MFEPISPLRSQRGFSLVELMVVVAIVSIIAGLAIPQYQTNAVKAQVARAMTEASALRDAVELCLNGGITTVGDYPQCDPGATPPTLLVGAAQTTAITVPPGAGVPQVTLSAAGTGTGTQIVATFGNRASAVLSGQSVSWLRDAASGSWTCVSTAPQKYMPPSCTGT